MKMTIPVLLLLLLLPLPQAAASPSKPDDQAYITVRELMRLEGELALKAARQRRGQGAAALTPAGKEGGAIDRRPETADALRLVGIYGVGKHLFAEVRSGTQAWLYLNGHSMPVGKKADDDAYRLKELAGACVRLERRGNETVLCLPHGGKP